MSYKTFNDRMNGNYKRREKFKESVAVYQDILVFVLMAVIGFAVVVSTPKSVLDPRLDHVGFLVERVHCGQFCLRVLRLLSCLLRQPMVYTNSFTFTHAIQYYNLTA
jgi:hypothetical protein